MGAEAACSLSWSELNDQLGNSLWGPSQTLNGKTLSFDLEFLDYPRGGLARYGGVAWGDALGRRSGNQIIDWIDRAVDRGCVPVPVLVFCNLHIPPRVSYLITSLLSCSYRFTNLTADNTNTTSYDPAVYLPPSLVSHPSARWTISFDMTGPMAYSPTFAQLRFNAGDFSLENVTVQMYSNQPGVTFWANNYVTMRVSNFRVLNQVVSRAKSPMLSCEGATYCAHLCQSCGAYDGNCASCTGLN